MTARPASMKTRIVSGEKQTPFGLARKFGAKVILESSSASRGRERYSILLIEEAFRLRQEGPSVIFRKGPERRVLPNPDILDAMEELAALHEGTSTEVPFPAGGIGYLTFEFVSFCDAAMDLPDRPDPLGLPLAEYLFGRLYIVFDHDTHLLHLMAVDYGDVEGSHSSLPNLDDILNTAEARIGDFDFNYMMESSETYTAIVASSLKEKEEYKAAVRFIRGETVKGNLFQGVPSRRLEITTQMPAIEAYRILRSRNPSPYQFYLDFGDYQFFGTSPEMHVKVAGGRVSLRPIAGTRRRGINEAEDRELAAELLADEKERAEHLMLVDLGRNDLGRICEVGSVEVTEMMAVEKYSAVMHIVSRVEGNLAADKTPADAVRATFPAGTVSGAPKIQAVKTLSRLENVPRSFYAGLVGYLEPGGNLDSCIAIRCALKRENRLFLQAGAGVVYDSDPQRELEETSEKLQALANAAGVEV